MIVEDKRCNACHQELGTFTEDAFHAGQRNDGTTCSWCHRPNQTSSGWSADSTAFVHAIHAKAKRQNPYTWHATTDTVTGNLISGFYDIGYPGVLSDCETCHLPGTYDFSAIGTPTSFPTLGPVQTVTSAIGVADGIDKRLYRTVASGTLAASKTNSPYVTASAYGAGYSVNQVTGVATAALATTLVTSPTVAVCSACHDSADAVSHFKINGGAFYAARGSQPGDPSAPGALQNTNETCLVCHGTGRVADIKVMHSKNR